MKFGKRMKVIRQQKDNKDNIAIVNTSYKSKVGRERIPFRKMKRLLV